MGRRGEHDPAMQALAQLVTTLDECVTQLEDARTRAGALLRERTTGRPWVEIVSAESRPLVVETHLHRPGIPRHAPGTPGGARRLRRCSPRTSASTGSRPCSA